jgi:hypothetical protein
MKKKGLLFMVFVCIGVLALAPAASALVLGQTVFGYDSEDGNVADSGLLFGTIDVSTMTINSDKVLCLVITNETPYAAFSDADSSMRLTAVALTLGAGIDVIGGTAEVTPGSTVYDGTTLFDSFTDFPDVSEEWGYDNDCLGGKCNDFSPPAVGLDTIFSTMIADLGTQFQEPGTLDSTDHVNGPSWGIISQSTFDNLSVPSSEAIVNSLTIYATLDVDGSIVDWENYVIGNIVNGDRLFIYGSADTVPEASTVSLLAVGGFFLIVGVIVRRKARSVR